MKRLNLFAGLAATMLASVACSDLSTDLKGDSVLDFGSGANSILTCNAALDGKVVKPADSKDYRLCKDGQWFAVEIENFDESDLYNPSESANTQAKSSTSAKSSASVKSSASTKPSVSGKSSSSAKADFIAGSSSSRKTVIIVDEGDFEEDDFPSSSSKTITIIDFDKPSSSTTVVPKSSANVFPESSSTNLKPVEDPYLCPDGVTVVINPESCLEYQAPESSSCEDNSTEDITVEGIYSCVDYNCVTTKFLNQEMLAAGEYGELLDVRDNQVYRTIKIGDQNWMAQNLNYISNENENLENQTWCRRDSCDVYGRFYSWTAAMDIPTSYQSLATSSTYDFMQHQGICPVGWHVPSKDEWNLLINYVDENNTAGSVRGALASKTSLWDVGYSRTDEFGFSVLPAGYYNVGGIIIFDSEDANFITASEDEATTIYYADFQYANQSNDFQVYNTGANFKKTGLSLRCIQDTIEADVESSSSEEGEEDVSSSSEEESDGIYMTFVDDRNGRRYKYITIKDDETGDSVTIMAENLNIGKMVLGSRDQSDDTAIERYCYNNDTTKCNLYGGLYQWAETLQLPSDCNEILCEEQLLANMESHRQGICPDGWHIPTLNEGLFLRNQIATKPSLATEELAIQYSGELNELRNFAGLNRWNDTWVFEDYNLTRGNNLHYENEIFNYNQHDPKVQGHAVRCIRESSFLENETSSGSEEATPSSSSTEPESSSADIPTASYDCSEYDCVTTEFLNQELLAAGKYGELLDERDGKVYRTIQIGEQTWMAQDLSYETPTGSWCYRQDESNCAIIGRAYTWNAALGNDNNSNPIIHGICPEGFHIPSDDEFLTLAQYVGGDMVSWTMEISSWGTVYGYEHAATALKSPMAWSEEGLTDDYGFSAVVAGVRWDYGGWTTTEAHDWWTSTDGTSSRKVTRNVNSKEEGDHPGLMGTHYDLWDYGFYIRCIQD